MKRTMINDIECEVPVKISGWIENLRDKKSMIFLVIKDKTGKIQVTIEKEKLPHIVEKLAGVIVNSVISVEGVAHNSEYVKMGGKELIPTDITVLSVSNALPITKDASPDLKMDYRWIDLRDDKNRLIFEIMTDMEMAMREYTTSHGFIEIHTPKISAQSTEGGAEVFKTDYFGSPAFLTQSPQLYKQMAMAAGFEKVFEIGPCYRAEQSFTSRHATEFMSFDIEMSYIDSHHDVMDMEEDIIKYTLERVSKKYGQAIKETFGVDVVVPSMAFPRLTFDEVQNILHDNFGLEKKMDMDTESERLICKYVMEKYGCEFVFITDYPTESRAFYTMKHEDNPAYSKSYDLLWKDQEITSGAQREHRPDVLSKQISEKGIDPAHMDSYIEFFRYGCPPHGGYAIGLARFTAKLLGLSSIKDATFLFRGPNRLNP